jgi:hypothetical protein
MVVSRPRTRRTRTGSLLSTEARVLALAASEDEALLSIEARVLALVASEGEDEADTEDTMVDSIMPLSSRILC